MSVSLASRTLILLFNAVQSQIIINLKPSENGALNTTLKSYIVNEILGIPARKERAVRCLVSIGG
jgi:hypothetical protein